MTRRARILEHIRLGMRGIEIGAYHSPMVPKAEGWDVLVLDVFPAERLRRQADTDPDSSDERTARVEEVDLLGPAHRLAELAEAAGHAPGSFDFIVSSHNFEHLPDPVRFLQAAERVLKPGGVLSMAIPDRRYCYDLLRPRSTLGALIEAWTERREQPTPRQVFEHWVDRVALLPLDGVPPDGSVLDPLRGVTLAEDLEARFADWTALATAEARPYRDAHCWTVTPGSAELLLHDLRFLGLTGLEVMSCGPTHGLEFVLHLRRPHAAVAVDRAAHYARRRALYEAMLQEEGSPAGAAAARLAGYADAQTRLDAMLASRSWQLTAPLRAVVDRMRKRQA